MAPRCSECRAKMDPASALAFECPGCKKPNCIKCRSSHSCDKLKVLKAAQAIGAGIKMLQSKTCAKKIDRV